MDSATEHGPAVPQSRIVYDALLSYSHAADGQLAPALRNGLLRFATPWAPFRWTNPVRSLRIFQDTAPFGQAFVIISNSRFIDPSRLEGPAAIPGKSPGT